MKIQNRKEKYREKLYLSGEISLFFDMNQKNTKKVVERSKIICYFPCKVKLCGVECYL